MDTMGRAKALACALLTVLVLVLQDIPRVDAYPTGAPDSACVSMVPGHGPSRMLFKNPFPIITVSSQTYSPLQTIYLVMEPNANAQIKGFFIQARPANDTDAFASLGTFVADEESRTACNHSAITHRRAAERYFIRVTWRAPPGPVGDIVFRGTVVNTLRDYYTEIYSQVITYQSPTTPTTTTTTEALWEDVTYTEFPPGYTFPTPSQSTTTTETPRPQPATPSSGSVTPPRPSTEFPNLPADFTFPSKIPANFTLPPGFPTVPANFTFPPGFPNVPANFIFPPGYPDKLRPERFKNRRPSGPVMIGDTNKGFVTCSINSLLLHTLLLLSLLILH